MRRPVIFFLLATTAVSTASAADPPVPSGPHPRLFMSTQEIAGYTAAAQRSGSSAASIIAACQDTIDNPGDYMSRGGSDGNYWPGSAVSCAFAYRVTQQSQYLTQAIKYLQASLDDDQTIGDRMGCVAGVDTNWQTWAQSGNGSAPAVIRTITHDTGYPIRWYGPDVALAYDWLQGAPGVSDTLLTQTRTCLTNWVDYYAQYGYHHDEAGANYGAGYVISAALAAVAIGNDGGADGHLWTNAIDNVFQGLLIGEGLQGLNTGVGTPAGPMVGGDWLEGWQYGPLSVLEYAVGARALEEYGAALPEMDAWTNSLAVRYIHGTVPALDGQWVGGDFDSTTTVYQDPSENIVDAVLAGPSSDQAAGWALFMKQHQNLGGGDYIYNAIAEQRAVTAQDYRAQTPAPAPWYLSHGSRAMYVRTSWAPDAFWGVFSSPPHIVSDHQHFAASNFVFSRGSDHLVVDPSQYGAPDTFETNAVTADSPGVQDHYAPGQTPWSEADLPWARASDGNVFAARSDFAKAFIFSSNPSDISYARREWVFLPEGEVVTVDRVHTADASHNMYVRFHTNTDGALRASGNVASGTVGGSTVAIHAVALSGGTPEIHPPTALSDSVDDNACPEGYPYGHCEQARFNVDIYAVAVPGPYATAIHVIDGLGSGEAQAVVGSINDATYDPGGENTGVIGAAVFRGMKQSYVVATSAHDGATGAMMTYGVPGTSASRHVVFDAPEAADGTSHVATMAQNGRCEITITAGTGGGFAGHPLMFRIDGAGNGCTATESTDVPTAMAPGDGGVDSGVVIGRGDAGREAGGGDAAMSADARAAGDGGAGSDGGNGDGGTGGGRGGCGCGVPGGAAGGGRWMALAVMAVGAVVRRRRR